MSDIELAIEQLKNPDPRIRREAAKRLGVLGDSGALSALQKALDDDSVAVVRTAILAIGTIGGCETRAILEPLLQHDTLWIRKAAVEALGKANCAEAAPTLVNLLDNTTLNALAREALVALKVDPDFF